VFLNDARTGCGVLLRWVAPEGRKQLEAIASLHAALTSAGVDYWLFGGCAVGFCSGDFAAG
jgi:hypothetical protein